MTLLDKLNAANSAVYGVALKINKYTLRNRDVPASLLAEFGVAYNALQAVLAELKAKA